MGFPGSSSLFLIIVTKNSCIFLAMVYTENMSSFKKLSKRLMLRPKDFSWSELKKLLAALGYRETNSGKTSGSRAKFMHKKHAPISLHKPHPKPILKRYQIKQIIEVLTQRGQLK